MKMNLSDIRKELERRKGERGRVKRDLNVVNKKFLDARRRGKRIEQGRFIAQEVARNTQAELEYHIVEPVNLALSSVFEEDAYNFVMDFNLPLGDDLPKSRLEVDLYFERYGHLANPMEMTGYGQVDVASYGLKIALLGLANPPMRSIMVMDEPFKNPDKTVRPKIGELMRAVSHSRGIQHIVITHDQSIIQAADRVFHLKKSGKTTVIEVEDR